MNLKEFDEFSDKLPVLYTSLTYKRLYEHPDKEFKDKCYKGTRSGTMVKGNSPCVIYNLSHDKYKNKGENKMLEFYPTNGQHCIAFCKVGERGPVFPLVKLSEKGSFSPFCTFTAGLCLKDSRRLGCVVMDFKRVENGGSGDVIARVLANTKVVN